MAPILDLTAVWYDDDAIELRVEAATDAFRGATEAYFRPSDILRLTDFIASFPRNSRDRFEFTSCEGQPRSRLLFYCVDGAAHTAVRASLRRAVASNSRPEEEDSVQLEICGTGGHTATFADQLRRIVRQRSGRASLFPSD